MTTLGPRLAALADRVLPGVAMADVGTDHAGLPVALLAEGRVSRAVGIDRRAGPLKRARITAADAGLVDDPRLSLRQGDGLAPLAPGEAATVVIAGMGGLRILGILGRAPQVLATVQRLVLQPNTEAPALREGLVAMGWGLVDEDLCEEGGRDFLTLVAEPAAGSVAPLSPAERLLGPILLDRRPPRFLAWLQREEARLAAALDAAGRSTAGPPARLVDELALVRQALDGAR